MSDPCAEALRVFFGETVPSNSDGLDVHQLELPQGKGGIPAGVPEEVKDNAEMWFDDPDAYYDALDPSDPRIVFLKMVNNLPAATPSTSAATPSATPASTAHKRRSRIVDSGGNGAGEAPSSADSTTSSAPSRHSRRSSGSVTKGSPPAKPQRLQLLPEHAQMKLNDTFKRWRGPFLRWTIQSSGQMTTSMWSVITNLRDSPNVSDRLEMMVAIVKHIIDGEWPHLSSEFERQFGIALPADFVSTYMPQG